MSSAEASRKFLVTRTTILCYLLIALSISSFMYTVKLFVSPVYLLAPLFSLCIIFLYIMHNKIINIYLFTDVVICVFFAFYCAITQYNHFGPEFVNLEISLLAYCAARVAAFRLTLRDLSFIYRISAGICVIILGMDTIWRLMHPGTPQLEMYNSIIGTSKEFYAYKYNSVMFAHSNATAMVAVCFLSLGIKLRADGGEKHWLIDLLFLLIIALSFSRAAYISVGVLALLYAIKPLTPAAKKVLATVGLFAVTVGSLVIFSNDGSFNSKFTLFWDSTRLINSINNLLFGIGLGEVGHITGLSSHTLPLTYLVEMGIVGVIFVALFLFSAIRKTTNIFIFLIPIAVLSLSHFLYAGMPFFTVPFALAVSSMATKRPSRQEGSPLLAVATPQGHTLHNGVTTAS